MKQLNSVSELMKKKIAFFENYEKITREIMLCDIEKVSLLIAQRQQLEKKIDKLDAEIKRLCAAVPNGVLLYDAVKNKCNYDDLPSEFTSVFVDSQKIFAIIARIQSLNPQIEVRIKQFRDEAQEKLKSLNLGNAAKASKFNSGLSSSTDENHSSIGKA